MKVVSRRKIYLNELRKARNFWPKVVELNNQGMKAEEIAQQFTNPKTGKHYSRGHIFRILRIMRKESE